jgi:hypothetical protein
MMRCMFRPVREIPGTLPSHSSRGKTDNSHQSASSSLRYMHDPKKEQEDSEITAPNDFPQGGPIKRIGSKVGRTPDLGNFSATLSQLSYQASLHLTIFATRRKPTCFGSLYTYPQAYSSGAARLGDPLSLCLGPIAQMFHLALTIYSFQTFFVVIFYCPLARSSW